MKHAAGATVLLLGVAGLLLYTFISRDARDSGVPASFLRSGAVLVQLGQGFVEEGSVRQFNGAPAPADVIVLTGLPLSAACVRQAAEGGRVPNGARIDLDVQGAVVQGFSLAWMPAGQRISTGILLHPDQMSATDWLCLPGVGSVLAERIVQDRHKNGEFRTLEGLERVSGIGGGQIRRWRAYFSGSLSGQKIAQNPVGPAEP